MDELTFPPAETTASPPEHDDESQVVTASGDEKTQSGQPAPAPTINESSTDSNDDPLSTDRIILADEKSKIEADEKKLEKKLLDEGGAEPDRIVHRRKSSHQITPESEKVKPLPYR